MHKIWYKKSARNRRETLPLGNGFTGVMVYGSHKKERPCFNDGTLWSGYPKDYNSSESLANLEKVRKLIFEGRNSEADALCEDKLKGFYSETFLPLGDILLNFSRTDKNINVSMQCEMGLFCLTDIRKISFQPSALRTI